MSLYRKMRCSGNTNRKVCQVNAAVVRTEVDIVEVWTLTSEFTTMMNWSILFSVCWYSLIVVSFHVFVNIILSQELQNYQIKDMLSLGHILRA